MGVVGREWVGLIINENFKSYEKPRLGEEILRCMGDEDTLSNNF